MRRSSRFFFKAQKHEREANLIAPRLPCYFINPTTVALVDPLRFPSAKKRKEKQEREREKKTEEERKKITYFQLAKPVDVCFQLSAVGPFFLLLLLLLFLLLMLLLPLSWRAHFIFWCLGVSLCANTKRVAAGVAPCPHNPIRGLNDSMFLFSSEILEDPLQRKRTYYPISVIFGIVSYCIWFIVVVLHIGQGYRNPICELYFD